MMLAKPASLPIELFTMLRLGTSIRSKPDQCFESPPLDMNEEALKTLYLLKIQAEIQPKDTVTLQNTKETERTGLFDDIIALILPLSTDKEWYESGYLIDTDS